MKKYIVALIVILIIVLGAILWKTNLFTKNIEDGSSEIITNEELTNSEVDIRSKQEENSVFKKQISISGEVVFINEATGDKIYLKRNRELSGKNPIADIYLNNDRIGEITEYSVFINQCSYNQRYCIITSESFGAETITKIVKIIDLVDKKLIDTWLLPQDETIIYPNMSSDKRVDTFSFKGEYKWISDNLLEIIAFYILPVFSNESETKYYRVSPKQVWQYDLVSNQYSLIKTTPN